MANSGLTPKEEKQLTERLKLLDLVLSRHFLLGGKEANTLHDFADKIRNRLAPLSPDTLDAEASAVLEYIGYRNLYWVEAELGKVA